MKLLQVAVAVGLLVLLRLIYPGVIATVVGVCYLAAAAAATWDRLVAIWLAFTFSALALVFSGLGTYRYFDNGFDYLAGNFPGRAGVHWPAYLFLFVAVGAMTVIVLHVLSWRWMLRPRQRRFGETSA